MKILKNFFILFILLIALSASGHTSDKIFNEAKKKFDKKDYENSKFLFQRNIVFYPKSAESYLYLAKIFNNEENQQEEEKNLDTTLLLEPDNEEAIYMLINIQLDRSNFDEVNILMNKLSNVCKKFCNKTEEIKKSLQDFEANEKIN
jgi:hypothetical protein